MPKRPASKAQLGFVHAEAKRGSKWAKKTVEEWHGKEFEDLPEKAKKKKKRSAGPTRVRV